MTGAHPTAQDVASAELRGVIAERFQREFEHARLLAESSFGSGWVPVSTQSLVDHAEADTARKEGRRMRPAAVVYTAEMDGARRHYMLIDGQAREVPSCQEGCAALLLALHLLAKHGGQDAADQVSAVAAGRAKIELRPE